MRLAGRRYCVYCSYLTKQNGIVLVAAVARCMDLFFGGAAIRYVLPDSRMTSRLHTMARNRQREKGVYST